MASARWYFADVLEHLFITACALSGHFRGCWLINESPLRRLYWWAVNVRWDDKTAQHSACPLCHFDRDQYVAESYYRHRTAELEAGLEARDATPPMLTTTHGCGGTMYRFDARTGRMDRIT